LSRPLRTAICQDEAATRTEAAALARRLSPGDLISLEGELGVGKTVFVRGLAAGLGLDPDAVSSPSFVLAIQHRGGRIPLLHCDLYRLPEGAGIDDVGIEEALAEGCIAAVEWGERLPSFLKDACWRVVLAIDEFHGPDARAITIIPPARGSDAPQRM
jgi:tRNA threonylcarbamoyladenosine biosynthesis protein TsaE